MIAKGLDYQGLFSFPAVATSKGSIEVIQVEHRDVPHYLSRSRHGIWYFRVAVPARLRAAFPEHLDLRLRRRESQCEPQTPPPSRGAGKHS